MKTLKRIFCIMMVILTIGSLCACGTKSGTGDSGKKTPEDYVRAEVESRGRFEYFGSSIGGNEIKSSRATITNVKKVTDGKYVVSGKIVMTDIYGTNWNNTFDCEVTGSGEKWNAGSFEYTSKNWSKG